jgi:hypothetical protein
VSIRLKIICKTHNVVMGRVISSTEGLRYQARRPLLPHRHILVGEDGVIGASVACKKDRRLREAEETTDVLLASQDAERYTLSPESWSSLPAWCSGCREERWITIDRLKSAKGSLLV